MNYHVYVSLANRLISFVDNGHKLKITDTHRHIQNGTLFSWMKEEIPGLDLTGYREAELAAAIDVFGNLSHVVDERRKMGITHNGLCLLIAYCLEAIDENPDTIQSAPKDAV